MELWYEHTEREQAGRELAHLQNLTVAMALRAGGKEGAKFMTDRQNALLAIATGEKPKAADSKSAIRAHVAALQKMGAKSRG